MRPEARKKAKPFEPSTHKHALCSAKRRVHLQVVVLHDYDDSTMSTSQHSEGETNSNTDGIIGPDTESLYTFIDRDK